MRTFFIAAVGILSATAWAGTIYSDTFQFFGTRQVGADLNNQFVAFTQGNAQRWSSNTVFQGGSLNFANPGYLKPSAGHSSQIATLPFTPGTGYVRLTLDVFLDDAGGAAGAVGIGFFQNNWNFVWNGASTGSIYIDRNRRAAVAYLPDGRATWVEGGFTGAPDSWNFNQPARLILDWDRISGFVTARTRPSANPYFIKFLAQPTNQLFQAPLINSVGLWRDQNLGNNSKISLFQVESGPPAQLRGVASFDGVDPSRFNQLDLVVYPEGDWGYFSSATVQPDGTVSLPVSGGTEFWVGARVTGFLGVRSKLQVPFESTITWNPVFLAGDVDGDDDISILDYIQLSNAFERNSSQPGWNDSSGSNYPPAYSDFDRDGEVSILDYLLLSKNYGRSAQPW
jgi:hypothetical protein